jgi:hypothetical protein
LALSKQAIARVARPGQGSAVKVIELYAVGPEDRPLIDDRMAKIRSLKGDILQLAIDEGEGWEIYERKGELKLGRKGRDDEASFADLDDSDSD